MSSMNSVTRGQLVTVYAGGTLFILLDLVALFDALRQLPENEGVAWWDWPIERISQSLEAITGGDVRVSYEIDPSLVGGVTLRVGDLLIDGSVKGRLARMRERILSAAG